MVHAKKKKRREASKDVFSFSPNQPGAGRGAFLPAAPSSPLVVRLALCVADVADISFVSHVVQIGETIETTKRT